MTTIVIFLLLIPLYLQANSQDLSPDRAILLSLKQHWGNPPSLSSWNSSSFHCDWPGVECTSGAITALHLAAKELSETIPSSIGQLNDIITVDTVGYVHEFIQWDNARGNVPNASTALSAAKLQRNIWSTALDLSNNQLSGNVVESIFHLRSKNLWLCSNNFFEKIPFELLDHHYKSKCLDRSNLCSDYSADGLASCPTSLCSDHRIKAFLKCGSKDDKSRRYFVITIVETAGCGAVGFAILYYLARKCWLKKHETIVARCKKFWSCGSSRVFINQASTTIAVKSISNARKSDHRLEKEFLAEVQTLGTIRHNNIVKLFCCISGKELKLLVYQYFENKSLDQWLHGNKREISSVGSSSVTRLDWPMRLHVAIGAAQGLCYMHHDCSPPIIHRDIKSSNILLDSEFNAKIADFGLAMLLTTRHGGTEIASVVAGTFGYIAPEYAYTTKVNSKSDIYSFGVVLLELTTGREAVTRGDHMNLAERAQLLYRDTSALTDALDDEIKDSTYLDQIITVFRLGVICTATSPSNRPSMKDCLYILTKCRDSSSLSSPDI